VPNWIERTIRRDDVQLALYELGEVDKPTVILVHGWPDTHHLWTHVAPLLAENYHVIAYDTRGYGSSGKPADVTAYHLKELAKDLFAVADAVSPTRPVHLVGHDWGSVQLWEAVTTPGADERIASFTSISGPNLDFLGTWARQNVTNPTPRNLGQAGSQMASSAYTAFFQTPVLPKLFFSAVGRPAVWRQFLKTVEGMDPAQVVTGPTLHEDFKSGLKYYRANIVPHLSNPDPRKTAVPVQELINTRDIALREAIFDDTRQYADKLWRRSSPTGHWLPYNKPKYVADAVHEFISGLGGNPVPALDRARVTGAPGRFTGKLAVITGGGSGIGRETAYLLSRRGAEVVIADLDLDAAEETAGVIKERGGLAHPYRLDVSDVAAFTEFATTVRDAHGVADLMINNAGIGLSGGALDASDEQIQRILDINLRAVITGSKLFGNQMVERGVGGHIVNLASAAAFTPSRSLGIYSATKAGVLLFSESLRAELASDNIGVTAVCPGIVDTNIVKHTEFAGLDAAEQDSKRQQVDKFYQRRHYTPDKVAAAIVRAVERNKAVAPVTPEAHAGNLTYKLAPWMSRLLARLDV
jgi:short-subunit dehydrogenase/pimeloyl-ACP methyl ester carboxylesterase